MRATRVNNSAPNWSWPNGNVARSRRASEIVKRLISMGHYLGIAAAASGAIIGFCLVLGFEAVWRPIQGGPATSPLTAILFILAGLGMALTRASFVPRGARGLMLIVLSLALFRLFELAYGFAISHKIFFFGILSKMMASGSVATGWNTALMFVFVASSVLLRHANFSRSGQIAGLFALLFPMMSLIGYAYGIMSFYGEMSLTTAIVGIAIAASPLLMGSRSGFIRAISSPWDTGRFSRLEIGIITTISLSGGFVIQAAMGTTQSSAVPAFVALISISAIITIGCCAVVLERNDHARRRAERAIARLATSDPLTSLFNRRFLDDQVCAIASIAKRRNVPIAILMIDIDRFKSVNDTYGHPAGDEIIREVAACVRSRIRSGDIAVRYGGEELLVLLMDTECEIAGRVAEELRSRIEQIDFSEIACPTITISIGVARLSTTISEAITRADAALYEAKRAGRNRVVVSNASPTTRVA